MKKLLISICIAFAPTIVRADNLIVSTLLDHVTTITQFKSGETKLALLDSVVLIGNKGGKSILDLQAGFSGATAPKAGEVTGANFLAGGFLKVSSLVGGTISFPPQWEFLRSLEHGPYLNYDFREKKWVGGYQVGLAFTLNPQ